MDFPPLAYRPTAYAGMEIPLAGGFGQYGYHGLVRMERLVNTFGLNMRL